MLRAYLMPQCPRPAGRFGAVAAGSVLIPAVSTYTVLAVGRVPEATFPAYLALMFGAYSPGIPVVPPVAAWPTSRASRSSTCLPVASDL